MTQILLIACGEEGFDIYDLSTAKILFKKNYNEFNLGIDALNVIDIKQSERGDYLYVLDYEKGLLIFYFNSIDDIV
jgi:hypothetical protein